MTSTDGTSPSTPVDPFDAGVTAGREIAADHAGLDFPDEQTRGALFWFYVGARAGAPTCQAGDLAQFIAGATSVAPAGPDGPHDEDAGGGLSEPESPAVEPLESFDVEVTRRISTTVTVEARDAAGAVQLVDRAEFPLPAVDRWTGHQDFTYAVMNANGELVDGFDD